jgi:hypothetical protein
METKAQITNVSFVHPAHYFATFMVNRLNVERHIGFTIGRFGLMDDSGKLLDSVGFIFTETMLKELRENLVSYSSKVGTEKTKSPIWKPNVKPITEDKEEFAISRYGVVDFIHLTNWEDAYAEICFWSYSKAKLADHLASNEKQPFPTWGLALLRCSLDLQREFLEALYPV